MPKSEPRACDGCRKRFKPGDQRIEDPDSTPMGTLAYHPKCRDGALWNHMGLLDEETREALVKRVFKRHDESRERVAADANEQASYAAARLAYFLANMGMIDTPGGAEWWGRKWKPEDLLTAFAEAGAEVEGKETEWLWKHEDYS